MIITPANLGIVTQIATGVGFTCALLANQTVRCWGANTGGDGSNSIQPPADLTGVTSISAGSYQMCAITQLGAARCWGGNWVGQTDVPADLGAVSKLGVGQGNHNCVITVNRSVRCWGWNPYGQTDVPAGLNGVNATAQAWLGSCAAGTFGVRCWGSVPTPSVEGAAESVVAGDYHACALSSTHVVTCAGDSRFQPPVDLGPVAQISAGGLNTCAITMSKQIRCWGMDNWGQSSIPTGISALFPDVPTPPLEVTATSGNSSATVSWSPPQSDGGNPINSYTVTASPGGLTCMTATTSCKVTGLTNRNSYTFTVQATNAVGTSFPSVASNVTMPLSPEFQVWSRDVIVPLTSTASLLFAQTSPGAAISVTGAMKLGLTADAFGCASVSYSPTTSGISRFTATYSVKVGKKTTKYTATTQLYVPAVMGPMLKIKQGKTGKFSLQFMPPGAAVSIALSDGRTLTATADSAGKASFAPTFSTLGAVTYNVSVAGVQIGTGGLTVTK